MKYNQPFDAIDPNGNAPYVNGNPAASIQGSIPPAAQMEYPQREIVAVIDEAGITPTNDDLKQLMRAIRSGRLKTFTSSGSANALLITPTTPHASIFKGLPFRIFPNARNTGATTLQVNGLGPLPLTRRDGTPMQEGDLLPDVPFDCVASSAGGFRLLGPAIGEVPRIVPNALLYVRNDGNDGNDGLANTSAGALKTVAAALSRASRYFLTGSALTVQLGLAATYPVPSTLPSFAGRVVIRGDANAQNTFILSGSGPSSGGSGVIEANGLALTLVGLTVQNGSTNNHTTAASNGGALTLLNVTLTAAAGNTAVHTYVAGSSSAILQSGIVIASGAGSMLSTRGGTITLSSACDITVTGNPAFSAGTAAVYDCGTLVVRSGASIIGTATGSRYVVDGPAVIRTAAAGPNFFPGSVAGSPTNGGQYFG